MTKNIHEAPTPIICGLNAIKSVANCRVIEGPKYIDKGRWYLLLELEIEEATQFIPKLSNWYVLLQESYPFGKIDFYPSKNGGISSTFPHQERNDLEASDKEWRNGKICLSTSFRKTNLALISADPIGDSELRLKWHVERALKWLNDAAGNNLLAPGDPFEVPHSPSSAKSKLIRIAHDECSTFFSLWNTYTGFGTVQFGKLQNLEPWWVAVAFKDIKGALIREWKGRTPILSTDNSPLGYWWMWPEPIVSLPWETPSTWGELRQIGRRLKVDVDDVLRHLAKDIRGITAPSVLLLGYPIPKIIGENNSEIYWQAVALPMLKSHGNIPDGFRENEIGLWHRDRHNTLKDDSKIEYITVQNWSPDRLQARGKITHSLSMKKVVILGVGALGSILAELLGRMGIKSIGLMDYDDLVIGNLCRHVGNIPDVDKKKVGVLATRLRQISPYLEVQEHVTELSAPTLEMHDLFEPYDIIIDCTASNEALKCLSNLWWSIPRYFFSASVGYKAQKIFSFSYFGNTFPLSVFEEQIEPWLKNERVEWSKDGETLEGAGCWSPLLPARYDDVVLAATVFVKELERILEHPLTNPSLKVFKQQCDSAGFFSFSREEIKSL